MYCYRSRKNFHCFSKFFSSNKNKNELLTRTTSETQLASTEIQFHLVCTPFLKRSYIKYQNDIVNICQRLPHFKLILSPAFFQWHFNLFLGRTSQYWVVKSTVEKIDVAEEKRSLFADRIWLIFNILCSPFFCFLFSRNDFWKVPNSDLNF